MDAKSIVLHCSATVDSGTVSWGAIRKFHTVERGWSDIGYHFGVEDVNGVLVIMQGRHPSIPGAHCKHSGYNSKSLGVCVVGEYDDIPPDTYRLAVTIDLLTKLCFLYGISPANVLGHSEIDDRKTCPGSSWDMYTLRTKLHRNIIHGGVDSVQDVSQCAEYVGDKVFWR